MTEISTVEQYFIRLRRAFAGTDRAILQDALYDAQEFLAGEREALDADRPADAAESELVRRLVARFGEPEEVVESYRSTEAQVAAAFAAPRRQAPEGVFGSLLGVFTDPRSYGALFYMLVALPLGIVYFTWATVGVSLSLGLSVLIFGFLFFLFFISTVRVLALVECRIVETLLGERMPRRPAALAPSGSLLERLKSALTDGRAWSTILYMVLTLPLGIFYFTTATVFLAFALSLLAAPVAQLFLPFPILNFGDTGFYLPFGLLPFFWLAGAFDLLLLLHLARFVGRAHGRLAKALLTSGA